MKLSENVIGDGYHPRLITDGINIAKEKALEILDSMKIPLSMDRCFLINVARSSLRTKVHAVLADHLAEVNHNVLCRKDLMIFKYFPWIPIFLITRSAPTLFSICTKSRRRR